MELRSGYKKTEIGVIPEEWELKPFRELFTFQNGVNADKRSYGKGARFINVLEPITYSHIHGPEIPGRVTLPESVVASAAVKRGDVLFNRTSETETEIGLAATYVGTERVVFGGFVIRGRPIGEDFDPVYSGYALRAPLIRSQIIPMGQGAIRANIGQEDLRRVIAPIPLLPEQRAIAAALSDVDALLGGLDQLIAKKRDLRRGAMQRLLCGRSRLPNFTAPWHEKRLGELGRTYGGLTGKTKADFGKGTARYVTFMGVIAELTVDPTSFDFVQIGSAERQNPVLRGDVLFNGSSETPEEVALCAFVDVEEPDLYLNSFCFGYRPTGTDQIDGRFLVHVLRSESGRTLVKELAQGSTRYNISKRALMQVSIPFPDLDEQIAIVATISDFDSEIAALEARLDKTRSLKQAMMQALLTGRVRLPVPGKEKHDAGEAAHA